MAFSLSTFLSIGGVIPLIAYHFNVPLTMVGLFVALFALILSITGLILPSYFSKYERKRFFMIIISVFILSSFLRIFIDNFYIVLLIFFGLLDGSMHTISQFWLSSSVQ